MDTPAPSAPVIPGATATGPTPTIAPQVSYPDSVDSSPRSRNAESFDEPQVPGVQGVRLRLMCSYGGQIVPRPHDKSLCYVGGDTRIVVVDRNSSLADLNFRLSKILLNGRTFTLKYQLPNEDLDSLITVSTEEDFENMVDEYDRLAANSNSAKPSRIRVFLFPSLPEASSSIGSFLDGSNKSDEWFLDALNGTRVLQRGFSDPSSVNCLLGLEEKADNPANSGSNSKDVEAQDDGGKKLRNNQSNQDVHLVSDSPIIETTSSFKSTSSSPPLANLPAIRVHVEDGGGSSAGGGARIRGLAQRIVGGIEEQFSQMGVGVQKQDDGFVVPSSLAAAEVVTGVPTEYLKRVVSDDEISDQGITMGYRKQSQPQPQSTIPLQQQQQQQQIGGDYPSPDSVCSDSSLANAISRQKPMIYQEAVVQTPPPIANRASPNLVDPKVNVSDHSVRVQLHQNSDSGYVLAPQYDPQQQQLLQLQQQQLLQHQQQAAQPQPQQFTHSSPHFIHNPAAAVPLSTYYPLYPSQPTHLHHHQLDQRYPVYYVPAGQSQAYNLPNFSEAANAVPPSHPQTPSNPTMITASSAYSAARNMHGPPKIEMAAAGVSRAGAAISPSLAEVTSGQHQPQPQQQFMGYSQIHHPPQSIAPTTGATGSYAFEFADPAVTQMYFTRPLQPTFATQYQTVASAPAMVRPDAPAQLPTDNIKQQIKSPQPS
ncbi:hypothetical protein Nepgr_028080 [Nepenthes gracilis]|uniref:PB1 domain-containing protein n=1 Tax=Nepenthes gracilis TaxID=150966 RepID=A0AAD3TCX9_NEPGR|nr:hypothetical protein Nepgr_028080 [Nepenthes gracilis]